MISNCILCPRVCRVFKILSIAVITFHIFPVTLTICCIKVCICITYIDSSIAFIRKNDFQNYLNDKLQEPKPVKNTKQQISTPSVKDKEQLELETELLKLELEL